ncbi:MAG: copper ABC transporter permease, partial [Lachnospiraceae bacterium]|nr:copper ABC transporter permease [Lachnospiraceae bacterium]
IDDETSSVLAVFTSQTMFTDEADSMVSGNNVSVFSDVISSCTDTDSVEGIVIPVKEYDSSSLTIASSILIAFGVIFVVVIPIILIILGIIIWVRRRRK